MPDKANETAAIRAILGRLPVNGALVTVDAVGAMPAVATAIQEAGADYVLALTANQPSLHAEGDLFFNDPANAGLPSLGVVDKDHGRLETRTYRVYHDIAWLGGNRRYPSELSQRAIPANRGLRERRDIGLAVVNPRREPCQDR